ncbi:galactonate dehydratase [Paenibacillus taihuensis]|uniref:Galactonate dehydratase n=1 Tax=Paenibacillus taihuensis TaxID=1156355 RepID=A0A3D9SNR4_9BACL|nr:mandelate racemase/muconate lactonizing enzyme family protein [Paenibacillus taihuensis]REE94585.1 galactonate dehydratase [Paenibacillus taihuensis]
MGLKITRVETLCLSRKHEPEREWFTTTMRIVKADCTIVIIHTDGGIIGIGEACSYGVPDQIRAQVTRLTPLLIGRDPLDLGTTLSPNGRAWSYDCAVSGIDCALWDIRGKAAGKRVSELLSDNPLERIELYASAGCSYDWRDRPEQLIEEAVRCMEQGFKTFKFRLGTHWAWDSINVDRMLGLIRELSSEVGGRMALALDGNQRLNEEDALAIGRGLDEIGGFAWFEEPFDMRNVAGYARLNSQLNVPVTGGEQYTTMEQFLPYLEQGAYAIVQQDAGICGITEGLRIAKLAYHHGVPTIPHNWHNGLMTLANAHMVAALPKPIMLELCMIQGPLQWGILKEQPVIHNGYLELPSAPGLGAEIAEGLLEQYPYMETDYYVTVDR